MKIGISISIDVKKILKERLYAGTKGTYLDLTAFIDTEQKDRFDQNGFISQSVSKEERAEGIQTPILGNIKIFYTDNQQADRGLSSGYQNQQNPDNQQQGQGQDASYNGNRQGQQNQGNQQSGQGQQIPDDDIPF